MSEIDDAYQEGYNDGRRVERRQIEEHREIFADLTERAEKAEEENADLKAEVERLRGIILSLCRCEEPGTYCVACAEGVVSQMELGVTIPKPTGAGGEG